MKPEATGNNYYNEPAVWKRLELKSVHNNPIQSTMNKVKQLELQKILHNVPVNN